MGKKNRAKKTQAPQLVEAGKWSTRWKVIASIVGLFVTAAGIVLVWKSDRDNRIIEVQKQVVEAQRHIMELSNQIVKASDIRDDDSYTREVQLKLQELKVAEKVYKTWEENAHLLQGRKPNRLK